MTAYINLKSRFGVETIDEFDTRKEAFLMCREYSISDNTGYYYVSQRSCKEWK